MPDQISTEAALGWWFDGSLAAKRAQKLERELNEANERMSRLIKAGDAIAENGSVSERLANEWNNAKGMK